MFSLKRVRASFSPEILQTGAVKVLRDVVAVKGLNQGGLRSVRAQHRQATREKLYHDVSYTANSLLPLL